MLKVKTLSIVLIVLSLVISCNTEEIIVPRGFIMGDVQSTLGLQTFPLWGVNIKVSDGATLTTESDGRYMHPVDKGTYSILFHKEGYSRMKISNAKVFGYDTLKNSIYLYPLTLINNLSFELTSASEFLIEAEYGSRSPEFYEDGSGNIHDSYHNAEIYFSRSDEVSYDRYDVHNLYSLRLENDAGIMAFSEGTLDIEFLNNAFKQGEKIYARAYISVPGSFYFDPEKKLHLSGGIISTASSVLQFTMP